MHAVRRGVVTTMTTGIHIIATCDAPTSRKETPYIKGDGVMAFDFTGKTAIVTGGTQGIGLEIAKGIVAGGGHVALIARNAAKGEAAVAELGEGNKFYQLDVADAPKARETVEQIFTDLPQTNILINCAGVISTKKFD